MRPVLSFSRGATLGLALGLAATAGAGLGFAGAAASAPDRDTSSPPAFDARNLSRGFADVVDHVRPSVVCVHSVMAAAKLSSAEHGRTPFPFRDFFGDRMPDMMPDAPAPQAGLGSGVIVSADGYVLTNNHVVRNAKSLSVTTSDGKSRPARVVGTDERTDLAILKLDAKGLVPAELGDSEALRTGDLVLAMGSPFGLSDTVTSGIVSAKGRANLGVTDYEDFIQTDASISPGNSGGPLVDMSGRVVGINTAILTPGGMPAGIGLAIPSNMAHEVMDSIIDHGSVERGWLGVVAQELTPELAKGFGYDGDHGILIGDVTEKGPAAKAGLRPGDILLTIDGREVKNVNGLRNLVASIRPEKNVTVKYVRDGARSEQEVTIGRLEDSPAASTEKTAAKSDSDSLGFSFETLTRESTDRLGIDGANGVLVTEVDPGSPAARAGLKSGDVILSIGEKDLTKAGELRQALRDANLKDGVRLRVLSGRMKHFVILKGDNEDASR